MRLRPRSFEIFWDVHAWVGVASALLLFLMFFMGAFALFYREINVWADPAPAARASHAAPRLAPLLDQLVREQHVIGADRVVFMPEPSGLRASWSKGDAFHEYHLVPSTGRLEPLASDLGTFLYSLHYLGPIPYGLYVAGVAAMLLFLALVTGLLLHLKDLVKQWFQFRPVRAPRTWTSDMHKVLGVFGLPYQLLYAWTGAVLCLGYVAVEPAFEATFFGGDDAAVASARGDAPGASLEPTGKPGGTRPDPDRLVEIARATVPGLSPTWIGIEHVGDEGSTAALYGEVAGVAFGNASVTLRASDGAVLGATRPGQASGFQRFEAWFYGLHYARFGGQPVRWVYALLALATCIVIATGNVIWLERRDRRRRHLGNRLLERLTVGVCAGVPLATALTLLANRVLGAAWPARTRLEHGTFWIAWAAVALWPFVRRSARRAAAELLGGAGATLVAVVAIDACTRPERFGAALERGVWIGLVLLAAALAAIGVGLGRRRSSGDAAQRASDASATTSAAPADAA